ncbi:O-antigen ligase family protein [Serratia fonticola]|uniref:O-antigen ligase family protein n=2 Tax=Serratia TaxID=613 RepID=UPI00068731C0|nr:O-antigen ligase family protein [Serratia fonticola]OKP29582.1 hypothetical protein BSQ40_07035 [Serratia fonticola]
MYIFCHYISVLPTEKLISLAKKYTAFYCLLAIYGTVCYLINYNPYIEFIESTTQTGRVLARTYADTLRGIRAQGTISHPITYGALLVIGLLTYYTIKLSKKKFIIKDYLKIIIITVVIMLSVLLTNSRSPLIFFGIAVLIFATMQGLAKSLKSIIVLLMIFVITFSVSDVFRDKVYSVVNIFNPEVGQDMNGSDLAMRGGQLAVSMKYLLISPVWGNGLDATRNIVSSEQEEDLYNSESILFRLMIDQGGLGLIAYSLFFIALYKKVALYISNASARKMYLGFIVGYIIFTISTGIMDTLQNMMFMVCFIYYYFRSISNDSARI